MLNVQASITLTEISTNNIISKNTADIDNQNSFSYIDNDNNVCRFEIYTDGLILYKKAKDYELTLNLVNEAYILVKTIEGELKLDAKIVDFHKNNDILVVRYIVDEEERQIEINYRS